MGDKITVKYSDGNERSGETNLDVLWKDLEPEDFNTTVTADLEDYYGNFINMNIPDVINTGQIIVTVKFKNNHTSNISNMDVSTDLLQRWQYHYFPDDQMNPPKKPFQLMESLPLRSMLCCFVRAAAAGQAYAADSRCRQYGGHFLFLIHEAAFLSGGAFHRLMPVKRMIQAFL